MSFERHGFQRLICMNAGIDQTSDNHIRIAERNTLLGQVIRTVGCIDEALTCRLAHILLAQGHGAEHRRKYLASTA